MKQEAQGARAEAGASMVHPEVGKAATLPKSWYLDPEIAHEERRKIWHSTWQYVARIDSLRDAGQYMEATVQGEPLVVLRDNEGKLRALSNVCRHRAGPLVSGAGHCRTLQCRYHGWTYDLDGKLRRAPEFEDVCDFDPAHVRLPEVRTAVWGPFVFVNLDPNAPSLEQVLGNIPKEVSDRQIDVSRFRFLHRKDYIVKCNWKVYVDNYLEGYHIPMVHPELFRELDYQSYRVETHGYHSRQVAPLRKSEAAGRRYSSTDPDPLYYWLFPNFIMNIYPDNLSVNLVLPLTHDTTLTIFEWYLPDTHPLFERLEPPVEHPIHTRQPIASLLEDRPAPEGIRQAVSFSDVIQYEDIEICESVQANLMSRTYERGRYSVRRENGVHHFHRLVDDCLSRPG